jgi:hypothetical protein
MLFEDVQFIIKIYFENKVHNMKRFYIILPLLVFILSYSCGGKDRVKPSADSLLAKEAFDRIEMIRKAYESKDIGKLKEQMGADLFEGIQDNINFDKAEMSFSPRMIRITGDTVIVDINWQGLWWFAKGGKVENRGIGNLVLQKDTLKLIQIEGDNPFSISSSTAVQ